MRGLKAVATFQSEAVDAAIEAREKRREAAIKREQVWLSDAKFMEEIQRLSALGRFSASNELRVLSDQCQNARNSLGPIEEDGIQAERHWEGSIWQLQRAEESLYTEFEFEFTTAKSSSSTASSVITSESVTSSNQSSEKSSLDRHPWIPFGRVDSVASSISIEHTRREVDIPSNTDAASSQESILVDLIESAAQENKTKYATGCDSGIADIDEPFGPLDPLPRRLYAPLELFPHSVTDFCSKRAMINDWLENNVFASQVEAIHLFTALRTRLEAENKKTPSNWAELIIAYWRLEGAANPHVVEYNSKLDHSFQQEGGKTERTAGSASNEKQGKNNSQETYSPSNSTSITDHGYVSDERMSSKERGFLAITRFLPAEFSYLSSTAPTQINSARSFKQERSDWQGKQPCP